jgi:hypothetical protein
VKNYTASADHQKAIIAPKERSNLSTSVNRVCNKEESAITVALKTVYFLAQEGSNANAFTAVHFVFICRMLTT